MCVRALTPRPMWLLWAITGDGRRVCYLNINSNEIVRSMFYVRGL